jgi:hypothetical protein
MRALSQWSSRVHLPLFLFRFSHVLFYFLNVIQTQIVLPEESRPQPNAHTAKAKASASDIVPNSPAEPWRPEAQSIPGRKGSSQTHESSPSSTTSPHAVLTPLVRFSLSERGLQGTRNPPLVSRLWSYPSIGFAALSAGIPSPMVLHREQMAWLGKTFVAGIGTKLFLFLQVLLI